MGASALEAQREIILHGIRSALHGDWKILIVDQDTRHLLRNAVREDDILREHVTSIEQIEDKRQSNRDTDAIYILSPQAWIIQCLLADLSNRRYRQCVVLWTSQLPVDQRRLLDASPPRSAISHMTVLDIDFAPRESHLISFKDPYSFPILFHPECNPLVRAHLEGLAQKIVAVCAALGENPIIRYYDPQHATHEARVLCSHLARFTQDGLDLLAQSRPNFPPPTNRPRGSLIITDRTMDLWSPLVHEFTYQAMVHDVLPLIAGDVVRYQTPPDPSQGQNSGKQIEISEQDQLWVVNRHSHMKDLLERLSNEFQAFKKKNPQFAETEAPSSLNNIKDMLAGLPQYQEGKEAFSLHLNMASDAMAIFQKQKLAEIASVEQSMATGLDEDNKKPKNVVDQVIRMLDEEAVIPSDRLRLIVQYILYRNGLLSTDTQKLLAHAQLRPQDAETVKNMDLLGASVTRSLGEKSPTSAPSILPQIISKPQSDEDSGLSRFQPALQSLLGELIGNTLDRSVFPFTRPQAEPVLEQNPVAQNSLRSAKPTWARTRPSNSEPRQRIIVFVAGGATYAESRVCHETSTRHNKDVFLVSSHFLNPGLFLRQVQDLGLPRRSIHLPQDQPPKQPPAHLFGREPTPPPQLKPEPIAKDRQYAMTAAMHDMRLNGAAPQSSGSSLSVRDRPAASAGQRTQGQEQAARLTKDKDKDKKRLHQLFGSRKT